MSEKKKSWNEVPKGGKITKPGSAAEYKTGGWRTFRPEMNEKKCINCMLCWMYCPDAAIKVEDGKMVGFDYEHCKGCGICAKVCPVKCIDMKKEK